MGQRSYREVVHAGLRDSTGAGKRQAAAGFQQRPAVRQPDRLRQGRHVEVIKQDQVGACRQRLRDLLEGVTLDLERQPWRPRPDRGERRADTTRLPPRDCP